MVYVGIDPDTEKSGVAYFHKDSKNVELHNFTYMELYNYLDWLLEITNEKVKIIIEKGEKNKAIFNANKAVNKRVAAKIGVSVGRNFEAANIIEQFCKYLGLDYEFYTPTFKKLDNKFVQKQFNLKQTRTNEEQRDALRCIMKYIL